MPRWVNLVLVAWLSSAVLGCPPPSTGPNRPVAAYGGRAAQLFDDAIEAGAVGLDPEAARTVRGESKFRERVQLADATVRVVVDTVTSKQEDTGPSYQVGFRVLDKLSGVNPPTGPFSVRVDKNSPSAGILKSYESQLVGKKFIAFVRLFGNVDGEREWHFHLSPDTKDVATAVQEATVLENFDK